MGLSEQYVSTLTAAMLTGKSVRTLQRWSEEDAIQGMEIEGVRRGSGGIKRMVSLNSLASHIPIPLDDDVSAMILRADHEEPEAMNTVALTFYGAEQYKIAVQWFEAAAEKGHPDAMDWLSDCYVNGIGVEKNDAKAIQWMGKAAEHGHRIAIAKLDALRPQMQARKQLEIR